MGTYAVGIIVNENGTDKIEVEAIQAGSMAEALGMMIIKKGAQVIRGWKVACNGLDAEVMELANAGRKIQAIKLVRAKHPDCQGLTWARDYVNEVIGREGA